MKQLTAHRLLEIGFVIAALSLVIGVSAGHLTLLGSGGRVSLLPGYLWKVVAAVGLFTCLVVALRSRGKSHLPPFWRRSEYFAGGLLVLGMSDFLGRGFTYFSQWSTIYEIILLGVPLSLLILRLTERRRVETLYAVFSRPTLVFAQFLVAWSFLRFAGDRFIFSDDHPSFLYRLILLRDQFPHVPFYNLDWNLGYTAREFISTGALSVFLFVWPLVFFGPPLDGADGGLTYNLLLVFLYVVIVPWAAYVSARMLNVKKPAATIAGLLALAPSLTHFEWLLKYGTLGFLLAAGLFPLGIVAVDRFTSERPSWLLTALIAVLFVGCSAWPVMGLGFVPLALLVAFRAKSLVARERVVHAGVLFALFILYLVLFAVPFFREFHFREFVARDALPGVASGHVEEHSSRDLSGLTSGVKRFRQAAATIHPVVLCFFIPGFFALRERRSKLLIGASVLWLLLLAFAGPALKPQLEMHRLVVPLFAIFSVLAAAGIHEALERLLEEKQHDHSRVRYALCAFGTALILGATFITPLVASNAYASRSSHRFILEPQLLFDLAHAIRNFGGNGRTMFLGFILHDLGASSYAAQDGGHIAPLAMLSGKELIASDFYHSKWTTVDPIPESFRRRGAAGIEEYLDLVNVTAVVTFKREWVAYCQRDPRYREVYRSGRFRLFVRANAAPSFVFSGKAEVYRRGNSELVVRPLSEEVVLKYRYVPSLVANSPELAVDGVPMFDEETGGGQKRSVEFVRLRLSPASVAAKKEYILSIP